MAKYREIKGVTVQTRDEDPSLFIGTWSAGGNLNTDRWGNAGAGIQTSGLSINGQNPNSTDLVEEYNGSSWTEIAETNNSRTFGVGVGANAEAVLHFTGWGPPTTVTNELWNGSAWTETTDLNTARQKACGAGTSTAAICIAGTADSPPDSNRLTVVEVWDGSSWTEVAEVNTGGGDAASAGTSTDSIKAGTSNGPGTTVETWDGSSFTETTELNTGRYYLRGSGPSGQTDTLVFGGTPPYTGKTEKWNGSTWTEVNDMSTARGAFASTNTTAASAWAAGGTTDGGTPGDTAATEEFSFPSSPVLTEGDLFLSGGTILKGFGIPTGTWATGGSLPVAQSYGGQTGTQTAGFIFGGSHTTPPSPQFHTESYDYNGTAWTDASADVNTGRESAACGGTSTSALFFAGTSKVDLTESYNGSSWTEVSELNTGRDNAFGFGQSNTASVCAGGRASPSPDAVNLTEVWNGSSWTEVSEMNATKKYGGATGTTTAGAIAGGGDSGEGVPITDQTELWNGTSWSEVAELNVGRDYSGGTGTSTQFLFYGGINPPGGAAVSNTEIYNGTSWTEIAEMGTAKMYMYSGSATGSATGALATGASPPSTLTQEFTADNALSTVTVS